MVEVGSGKLLARFRLAINLVPLRELSCHAALNSVLINGVEWADRNLDVRTFNDGVRIPEARGYLAWEKSTREATPAWCHYGMDEANCAKYGKLYSFPGGHTTMERICPYGWEIPRFALWLGMMRAIYNEKYKLDIDFTQVNNQEGEVAQNLLVALRDAPFRAVLGGVRDHSGAFEPPELIGRWIVRDENDGGVLKEVGFRIDTVTGVSLIVPAVIPHSLGCSVRLVRTASP